MKKIFSLLIVMSLIVGTSILNVSAQTNRKKSFKGKRYSYQKNRRKKSSQNFVAKNSFIKTETAPIPVATPTPIVPVIETNTTQSDETAVTIPQATDQEIQGDLQSGNVVVNVGTNGNAIVKIGLAERAVSVVDFPANDPVYRIHPGDENFVTVGCTAREQNGKCGNSATDAIILRPGKNFHSLGSEDASSTVVTIQRVSGIVVTLIVVPVKNVSQNANYVVVRYNTREVVDARLKAGLAVNLQPGVITLPNEVKPNNEPAKTQNADYVNASLKTDNQATTTETNSMPSEDDLQTMVVGELERVAQSGGSGLKFSKPVYGLSLARAAIGSRTGDITIEVVAVRNTLGQAMRLVPDQPELVVENKEKRDASVNIQRVNILHTATTVESDDVLLPGQVYYFAFAYSSPILGVKQVLRVFFAQREASDAPASMELSGFAR